MFRFDPKGDPASRNGERNMLVEMFSKSRDESISSRMIFTADSPNVPLDFTIFEQFGDGGFEHGVALRIDV